MDWCGFWMLPSVCSWECRSQKAAGTGFSQNLVDYFFWHYPASAVVFTNLVELASLHEISQLTDVEKQQLQPNATVASFSGLLTLSIVALEEEGVHVHV